MSLLPETVHSTDTAYLALEDQFTVSTHNLKRVSFQTLGCRLNQSETDVLARRFEQQGYRVVPNTESADICVINTCTVTEHSDAKNRQAIRALHRFNPKAMIAVVGCYAQINPKAIASGGDRDVGSESRYGPLPRIPRQ